jgi:hypothetical protein
MLKKTDLQKFDMAQVKRSQIIEHPHNPRLINNSAKSKLKSKMKEVGLIQPLIVNKRNMYLLGGHQRLAVMDSIERYSSGKNDYLLDVAVVDLQDHEELEMLVFLNNPSSQGTWDTELLAEINLDAGISFSAMGFDNLDIDLLFDGDSRFSNLLADIPQVQETKDALENIKAHRAESTEAMKEAQKLDWYFIVVCKDKTDKATVLAKMKLPAHENYISSDIVINAIKV